MKGIGNALTGAFGPDRDAQIRSLTTMIGQLAQGAIVAADFIVGVAEKVQSTFSKAGIAVQQLVLMYSEKQEAAIRKSIESLQGIAAAKPRLMELQAQLASVQAYNRTLVDEINNGLANNDKRN